MDITIQYSPELLEILIDAIPRVCLTEQDVLIFFHENGVGYQYLSDLWLRVEQHDDNIQKDEIVRTALTRLNEQGESKFQQRKIILERVKKTCDFSQCLPSDVLKVKELVSKTQEDSQVNNNSEIETSFTTMNRKLEKERTKKQEEHDARIKEFKKKQEELDSIKNVVFKIVAMPHGQWQESSEPLSDCINRLFKAYDINLSKPYEFVNQEEESNREDITGIVEIDGHLYSLVIIWRDEPLGKTEISPHLVTLFQSELAGGIYISKSGYTHPAIEICGEALSQKIITLCELKEILFLLESRGSFLELLKSKIKTAVLEKQPLFHPPGYVQPEVSRYSKHHATSDSKLDGQKVLEKVIAYQKHRKVEDHYKSNEKKDAETANLTNQSQLFIPKTHPATPPEKNIFHNEEEIQECNVEESYKIIDKKVAKIITPKSRSHLTIKKPRQESPKEENLIDSQEKMAESRLTGKKKTTNKKSPKTSTPPSIRKKAGKDPSKEEQILVGKNYILDRYVMELKKRSRGRGVIRLRRLLDLQQTYPDKPFLAAVKQASKYGLYDSTRLEKIILDNIAGGNFFDL